MVLPMIKLVRYPRYSAESPPIKGPIENPIKVLEERKPREAEIFPPGVPAATRVAAAVTVPVKKPWAILSISTAEGLWTRLMRKRIRVPVSMALSIISLRP